MDWNVGTANKLQIHGSNLMPQVNSAASVTSQANVLMQNFCNSSGNSQTTNVPSSLKYILANKSQFQNNSASKSMRAIFPKTAVSDTNFGLSNKFYNLPPSSLSTMTVQMAAHVQNPNLSKNMHISSSIALPGSTVTPVQNIHQEKNAYMATGSFNNQLLQNCSNSMRTSVYQQAPLNSSSPKGSPMLMRYYYIKGPVISQGGVSLNSVSDYYLPPQQNIQCPDYSSAKNCPNPGILVARQSEHYASNQINPPPYQLHPQYDIRNTVQATNINSSLLDRMAPVQANHGQFVLQQPTANLSNENVGGYHNALVDQNSNLYSVQPDQKSQSLSSSTETNVVGATDYNVNELKTTMELSNESVKSFVEVEGNLSNNVSTAAIVQLAEPLPQMNRTLQQGNNVSNENLSKDKPKITRESLSLDVQALYEMRNALLKLKDDFKLKQKIYQSSLQNGQTSNTTVNKQNPNNVFPPCNTSQSVVSNVQQFPSNKATPNQFSSNSHNSSFIPQKTKNHLLPILWNMLKGTGDENMLFSADVEGEDKYQNKYSTVQENACSNGDASENPVNTDRTTRLSYETSLVGSTKGTIIKNHKGLEQISNSVHNQLEKIPAASNNDLVNPFKQNRGSEEGIGQYLNDNLQNLVEYQNSCVSQRSSSMKNSVKEENEELHCSIPACLIQHSENTCLQKPGNSENISDMTSSSPASKGVEAITRTPHVVERTCSLEELKTSLDLWRKCHPASLNEQLKRNVGSSSNGLDDKGTAQILENFPNTLTQNYDTKITVERTQTHASSSFGKNLDGVNSNLPKGSEPQVAIVTPRVLSKNNEVQKNNRSLYEIMYPGIEEGNVHTLEELISAKSVTNKGEKRTICSPVDSCKYFEDLNVHQETNKSTEKNKTVKSEVGTNYSFDLNQEITNSSPLELKQHKVSSGDQHLCELITNYLTTSPQKCATSKIHGPNLDESNNITDIVLNDSMLQISSVCTLVQGDALYNSQIANIFSTRPLKSGIKCETSEEHMLSLQHNEEESGLSKNDPEVRMNISEESIALPPSGSLSKAFAGKPEDLQTSESSQRDKTLIETNVNDSGEQKNNDFLEIVPSSGKIIKQDTSYSCNADLSSNEVFGNQEDDTDNLSSHRKAVSSEHVLDVGKAADLGSSTEPPVMLLSNQLTELSKEFPYGIGYLNMVKGTGSKDSVTILTEREDKEKSRSHEKSLDPSNAVEQIKVVILNSQQMSEVFPECSQQSSNKQDNHGDDQMTMDSKGNLRKDKGLYRKSIQDLHVDSKTPQSERFGKTERTYCCLPGWLASGYNVEPCSCMLAKEPSLKGKAGLYSQSKDRSKSRDNESDCSLKNEVQNSILDAGSSTFLLEGQSNKALNKTFGYKETEPQVKEDKQPKTEQAATPPSLLRKPGSQQPNKRVRELPRSADSQSLRTERAGTNKIHNQIHGRRNFSKSEAQYHLNTDFKKILIKQLAKMKSEKKSFDKTLKSKTDIDRHRRMETKHGSSFERYKIKRDTSETRMIKGPISSKSLKRQMAKGKKHKTLGIQHNDVTHSSASSSVSFDSEIHDRSEYNSTLGSQEHLIKKKLEKVKDLEKRYGYKKAQYNESIYSKHVEHNPEQPMKRINLEKYAYTKDKKNAWTDQSSHFNNRVPTSQNEKGHSSNTLKICCPGKEGTLDGNSRDKWSERSFSDKKCFKRKNKFSVFLQKEKKNYLNRVAFKRIAQKTIHLTSLDSMHFKPVWQRKPNYGTGGSEPHEKSISSSQMSEAERPQMLEFKMCPDLLFTNSISEEETFKATKLPEKARISVTAVKSKREDWLNYSPVKRRKTEENEIQADDNIPLDTAIRLLEGNEVFPGSMKDSKTTFETYRKMHLEKRSRSLESSSLS